MTDRRPVHPRSTEKVNVSGCAVKDSDVHAGVHVRERPVRAAEKVTVSGGLVKASMQAVLSAHMLFSLTYRIQTF